MEKIIVFSAPDKQNEAAKETAMQYARLSKEEADRSDGQAARASEEADRAKGYADRIDLGVLDAAVLSTGTDAETALLAKQAAEQAAIDAANDANAQITPNVSAAVAAKNAAETAKALSEAAALAAVNSNWTYIVEDNAALLALAGMTANQTAFVKANEHQWKYESGVWVDKGPSVISAKAEVRDLEKTAQRVEPFECLIDPDDEAPPLFGVFDSNGALIAGITGRELQHVMLECLADSPSEVPAVIDAAGNIVQWWGEPPSDDPPPLTVDVVANGIYNAQRLRRSNMALAAREAGQAARLSVMWIGDSWVDGAEFWLRNHGAAMRARYGDGGIGYVDIGSYRIMRDDLVVRTFSGTWTVEDEVVPGPAIYCRTASDVGAKVTFTITSATGLSAARLYWIGTSDGTVRYRWGGGAWTDLNVQGTGCQSALLAGNPSAGGYTLEIEVLSGTVRLCGVDFQSTASGVVIHKCGNSGSRGDDWLSVNAAHWQAGVAALNPDCVCILLGTNDRSAEIDATTYADRIVQIIERVRAALPNSLNKPGPDILVVLPSEVFRTNVLSMKEYREALLSRMAIFDFAMVDLIDAIGWPRTRRDWFDGDGVHPLGATGGLIVARRITSAFSQ